jgi:hypothetical protein
MTDGDVILTRDKSSGRVHKRLHLGNGLATLEGDNLEEAEAGAYEVIATIEGIEPDDLCRRCFGESERA